MIDLGGGDCQGAGADPVAGTREMCYVWRAAVNLAARWGREVL